MCTTATDMFVKHSESLKRAVVEAYLKGTMKVRQLAALFKIAVQSIYRWVKQRSVSTTNVVEQQPHQTTRGRPCKVTSEVEHAIAKTLVHHGQLDKHKIKQMTERKINIKISNTTIYRCLHKENMSYKRTHFRSKRPDEHKMEEFRSRLPQNSIISLDESSFDTHMTSKYGWSKRGQRCILYPSRSRRARKRFSLMLAISNKHTVASQLVAGSFNKARFISFLQERLLPVIRREDVILMDNVRFHHSKEVKQILNEHHIRTLYNPPYHPDSNPVEMAFSMIKSDARRSQPSTKEDVESVIEHTTRVRLTPTVLQGLFNHALHT